MNKRFYITVRAEWEAESEEAVRKELLEWLPIYVDDWEMTIEHEGEEVSRPQL